MILKKDDKVTIECDGRTVTGEVLFASPNGLSLMLQFEALLHGHAGRMPVTMRNATEGFSIIDGTEVVVRKAS